MPGFTGRSTDGVPRTIVVTVEDADTDTAVYSPTQKGRVTSLIAANRTGGTLPLTVKITRGADTHYVVKDHRVPNGENRELAGNGIIVQAGDVLEAVCPVEDSFDLIVSAVEGLV